MWSYETSHFRLLNLPPQRLDTSRISQKPTTTECNGCYRYDKNIVKLCPFFRKALLRLMHAFLSDPDFGGG